MFDVGCWLLDVHSFRHAPCRRPALRLMIELWQLPLLFATGLGAGFVDSMAGGGGLIALPVLLNCGLDPKVALGTSKLQSSFGSSSAAFHYVHGGAVTFKECARGFVLAGVAAALGTLAVQQL